MIRRTDGNAARADASTLYAFQSTVAEQDNFMCGGGGGDGGAQIRIVYNADNVFRASSAPARICKQNTNR